MNTIYRKIRCRLSIIIILALIMQMLMPIALSYANEGAPRDLGDIFTKVNLTIKQGSGPESPLTDGDLIEITDDTTVKLALNWEIADDVDLKDGDYATLQIPDAFKPFAGALTGQLLWSEDVVGTFTVDKDTNVLKVTFNNELAGLSDRHGDAWVWVKFNLEKFNDDVTQSIKFEYPVNKAFTITAKPGGTTKAITKSGKPNASINADSINWVIDVNTSMSKLTDAIVEDTIPSGLTLEPGSIAIYDLTLGLNGNVTKETLSTTKSAIDFPVNLGEINSAYRIKYQTTITDPKQSSYNNIATLKDGGSVKGTANFDIGKLTVGNPIEKSGVANNGGVNSTKITWTIDVNKAEADLKGVSVADSNMTSGLNIDTNSIKVYELTKSGTNWVQGTEITSAPTAFPVDLGDIGKNARRIVFDTAIDYPEWHQTNVFNNTAVLKIGAKETNAPATVTVTRGTLIEKSGQELTAYGEPYIKWTIDVNKANHKIDNATITDTIGAGLALDSSTIKVYDKNNTDMQLKTSPDFPRVENTVANSFKVLLGDITEHYRIEYQTKITDPSQAINNEAELWGNGLTGDGIVSGVIKTGTIVPSNTVNNSYTKGQETNKTVDGIIYDGLNHTAKTMSWKLTADAIKEQVTALTITDTFAPANSMVFMADSLRVQKSDGTLVSATTYALTDNKKGGFVLTFNSALDRAKYEIYYKTSFDPDEVLANGGTLNNISRRYTNNAAFSVTTVDVKGNTKTINPSSSAYYDINQTVFNGGKKDADLDKANRKIKWNIYVNAMGQDLKGTDFVITDTLSSSDSSTPGQEYDRTTLVVKEYSLKKDGSIIVGNPISESYSVDWSDADKKFVLTFPGGIDKPYMVEFYTKIVGISKQTYKNDAQVSGKDSLSKTYSGSDSYPDWNSFLIKEAEGNPTQVYTDDEIKWKLTVNKSLSDIEPGAVLTDTISNGLVYVENSLVIKRSDGSALEEGAGKDYTLAAADASGGAGKTLTITFKDRVTSTYTVEYVTVVTALNGVPVNNTANFSGQTTEISQNATKQWTVSQFSGGTGSGTRSGGIKIVKYGEDNTKKLKAAVFNLYYMLNGERQYVKNSTGGDTHSTDNNGELEFKNLTLKTYWLQEVTPPNGYSLLTDPIEFQLNSSTKSITKNVANVRPRTDITATKAWVGGPDSKPSINLQLYQNGNPLGPSVELSNGYPTHTWSNLYVMDESGNPFTYTVDEVTVPDNYIKSTSADGLTVTNTYQSPKITVIGHKNWVGGPVAKPDIQLQLYRDGAAHLSPVTLSSGTTAYTWTGLDQTDAFGVNYTYTVDEVGKPANYGSSRSDDGLTVTNTYASPKTDITGRKVWVNGEQNRPEFIELQLYRQLAGGEKTAVGTAVRLEKGTYEYVWKDMSMTDADGNPYTYTADEVNVPENYTKSIADLTVTNTYEIPKTEITGKKIWVGGQGERPVIELQLYQDGKAFADPVKLENGKTEWIWQGLDKTDVNGIEHKYTVGEVQVPERYVKSISRDGLTVTNTYVTSNGGGGGKPTEPPKPPVVPPVEPPEQPEKPEIPKQPEKPEQPEQPKPPEQKETTENTPVDGSITVPEGEIPTVGQPPKNGKVEVNEKGNWTYTPDPGFKGKDNFTIKVKDKDGNEQEILIEVDVNEIPQGAAAKTLPKTGEEGRLGFYGAGLLLIAAGLLLWKSRRRTE